MIQSYVLLGTLGIHSIEDMKEKKITVTFTLLSGIFGLFLHLLFPQQSIFEMMLGMVSGGFILLAAGLGRGKIGMGDGLMFMLTGMYLGFSQNVLLMFLSFSLAGVWGLILVCTGRRPKDGRIPLAPFLFLGYFIMIIG